MLAETAFFDSNVICYLFGSDPAKADRAEALLAEGGTVSVQTLAEVTNVARRKARLEWTAITTIVETVATLCEVVPLTLTLHRQARDLAAEHGFSYYDAQIVAAAAAHGCAILWSEDMQDGRKLVGARGRELTIRNPFAPPRRDCA